MSEQAKKYRVALLGLGPRGHSHIKAFLANPDRFELTALCDLDTQKLKEAGETYGIQARYTDARTMLRDEKPDIFCFVTPLALRREMVEIAVEAGIKALAFEKPLAHTIGEAWEVGHIIAQNGIKAVVSHQLKYMTAMQTLRQIIESGAIGQVTHAHATTVPWYMQLGTHFTDYMMWANGGHKALWAVGHTHGKHHLDAKDGHFGADYLLGEYLFANGVRGYIECGYLAPSHEPQNYFWLDDRLTFYGTEGFAWADNRNRWNIVSSREHAFRPGEDTERRDLHEERMQARYMRDFADWLDGGAPHPCRYEMAYRGFEALQAALVSSLERRRVDLPLNPREFTDINDRMRKELPDVPDSKEWLDHGNALDW